MDIEIEEMKQKRNIKSNKFHNINKILYLQIINLLLIILTLIYQIKNIFLKKKNQQKSEENSKIIRDTISEKLKYLRILTNNNENEYKGIQECLLNDPDEKFCIYHLLLTKEVVGKQRILLGKKGNGCYVILDDFENIKYAYSFGIDNNVNFDKALADRGIDIYMYDHTIMWKFEAI